MSDQTKPSDVAGAFTERASAPPTRETGEWNISASARAELGNAQGLDEALDAHDRKWGEERRKIASASDPYPDFDLGSRGHRNILGEYEERRTVWEMEREGIERFFSAKRDHIRGTNPTLAGEFARNGGDGKPGTENDFSFPAPSKDDQTLGHAFEAGQDKSRSL